VPTSFTARVRLTSSEVQLIDERVQSPDRENYLPIVCGAYYRQIKLQQHLAVRFEA
jgi:hypothetical protein